MHRKLEMYFPGSIQNLSSALQNIIVSFERVKCFLSQFPYMPPSLLKSTLLDLEPRTFKGRCFRHHSWAFRRRGRKTIWVRFTCILCTNLHSENETIVYHGFLRLLISLYNPNFTWNWPYLDLYFTILVNYFCYFQIKFLFISRMCVARTYRNLETAGEVPIFANACGPQPRIALFPNINKSLERSVNWETPDGGGKLNIFWFLHIFRAVIHCNFWPLYESVLNDVPFAAICYVH